MTFKPTKPTKNFPIFRAVSETERWEVGLVPVLYGVRVRAGLVGAAGVEIDYCAGDDRDFQFHLLVTIVSILSNLPETITERELQDMMPTYKVRPINHDPCWIKLQKMATSKS